MLLEEGICYDQCILLANSVSLCPASFCIPKLNLPVTPGISWLPTFAFQGKPFTITVIQVYAPTNNAEEAEVKQFYEDLQDLLELTPKKGVLFIIGDWNAKVDKTNVQENQ